MSRIRQMVRLLLLLDDTPHRIGLAFGIGLFIAFFPILGIHTGVALLIAFGFRLSRVAILAGAWTNNPWTIAPMYTAGTVLGAALLAVSPDGLSQVDWTLTGRAFYEALYAGLRPYVLPFVVGNLVAGAVSGLAGYLVVRSVLERRRRPVLEAGRAG